MAEKIKDCISDNVVPFRVKLRKILRDRGINTYEFEADTGIARRIFYEDRKRHKATLAAIAYYLNMTAEDLVDGTEAIDDRYC